jgi:hypothetical protein
MLFSFKVANCCLKDYLPPNLKFQIGTSRSLIRIQQLFNQLEVAIYDIKLLPLIGPQADATLSFYAPSLRSRKAGRASRANSIFSFELWPQLSTAVHSAG